jgi:hypothetical protein
MPKYLFTINISYPVISGRYTTEATSVRQAIKNIVVREDKNRSRSLVAIAPKALPVASKIFDSQLYKVEQQLVTYPEGVRHTQLNPVIDNEQELANEVDEAEKQTIRNGDQEYPENPDEEEVL